MARTKSSGRWLREHERDPYVKQAREAGYRSRAAFKLLEIDDRDRLLRPGITVLDLGAAPGGWSQIAAGRVGNRGRVMALDILPMDPLAGVEIIEGDFRDHGTLQALLELIDGQLVDLVLSDMAPNMSGIRTADQARAMHLSELALDLCSQALKPGGALVVKAFHGDGFEQLLADVRKCFKRVHTRKPGASRERSSETYLVGREYAKLD